MTEEVFDLVRNENFLLKNFDLVSIRVVCRVTRRLWGPPAMCAVFILTWEGLFMVLSCISRLIRLRVTDVGRPGKGMTLLASIMM